MYSTMYGKLLILILAVGFATCLEVDQCDGHHFKDLENRVSVSDCEEPPCVLKKGRDTIVQLRFTPGTDHPDVTNDVKAIALGLPLPFFGVTGTSICDNIYVASNPTVKATCPIKAHTEYIYKNIFPIRSIYPNWDVTVHWKLTTSSGKSLICFEVPATITS